MSKLVLNPAWPPARLISREQLQQLLRCELVPPEPQAFVIPDHDDHFADGGDIDTGQIQTHTQRHTAVAGLADINETRP